MFPLILYKIILADDTFAPVEVIMFVIGPQK